MVVGILRGWRTTLRKHYYEASDCHQHEEASKNRECNGDLVALSARALDESEGVFNGKIFVRKDAQKTNAYQSNKNILVGAKSSAYTKPQLEIFADDVKCSHGCTIGQLDDEALFYLRARGISEKNAKSLLLHAFAVDILKNIKPEPLRRHVDRLISNRLEFNF